MKKQTVTGILTPIIWNKRGKPIKFSIFSDEGEDLVIKEYRYKIPLQRLLNKRVQAIGEIFNNKYGDRFIKLKKIKELTDPNSPSFQMNSTKGEHYWDEEFSVNVPKGYQTLDIFEPSYNFAS